MVLFSQPWFCFPSHGSVFPATAQTSTAAGSNWGLRSLFHQNSLGQKRDRSSYRSLSHVVDTFQVTGSNEPKDFDPKSDIAQLRIGVWSANLRRLPDRR